LEAAGPRDVQGGLVLYAKWPGYRWVTIYHNDTLCFFILILKKKGKILILVNVSPINCKSVQRRSNACRFVKLPLQRKEGAISQTALPPVVLHGKKEIPLSLKPDGTVSFLLSLYDFFFLHILVRTQ